MPTFKLPLSGDVVQSISPWTAFLSPIGSQYGLVNITIDQSSEPAVEADALSDVAGYGKQLGRIGDALIVLLAHFHPATPLTKEETDAIDDLKEMLHRIAEVKEKHKRKALRPEARHTPTPVAQAAAPVPAATALPSSSSSPPAASAPAPREPTPPAASSRPSRRTSKNS
jgi:hypothetical protein